MNWSSGQLAVCTREVIARRGVAYFSTEARHGVLPMLLPSPEVPVPLIRVQDRATEHRLARGRHCTAAILAVLALVLPLAAPVRAAPLTPVLELTLPAALMLMPDTPTTRSTGVWYADYALAERVYGVGDIAGMTDPRITRFFQALVGLRPGPETGVSALTGRPSTKRSQSSSCR